ncbi:hypothetical protein Fmac_021036 [Flemingia macrophylla]|uniref:ETFB lysine methyltransferase n=1 Tax=Flemingia macrophylla TaxID=520843 RepID=A0ABD1LVU5_9FABA
MFIKSVDGSDFVKTGEKLFELLDSIVEEIGEEKVVQVITDNRIGEMDEEDDDEAQDERFFDGDDPLTWEDIYRASGVGEPIRYTRRKRKQPPSGEGASSQKVSITIFLTRHFVTKLPQIFHCFKASSCSIPFLSLLGCLEVVWFQGSFPRLLQSHEVRFGSKKWLGVLYVGVCLPELHPTSVFKLLFLEICISSIFHEVEDINVSISHAADSIDISCSPIYEIVLHVNKFIYLCLQESLHPVQVTESLWVVPKWCTPPDVQATNIIVNPGLAFGTGEHTTTKLCLLLLHSCIQGGEHFLDYGTGTGILAIAALKFGAAFAVGVDVDSEAIASASENASLNNIGPDKLQLRLIDSKSFSSSQNDLTFGVIEERNTGEIQTVTTDRDKYDVVIANILLNPLLDLSDHIVSLAKPGAVVGLSGILSEQVQYIIERYSPFLEGIKVCKMDDWACVSGRKSRYLNVR